MPTAQSIDENICSFAEYTFMEEKNLKRAKSNKESLSSPCNRHREMDRSQQQLAPLGVPMRHA